MCKFSLLRNFNAMAGSIDDCFSGTSYRFKAKHRIFRSHEQHWKVTCSNLCLNTGYSDKSAYFFSVPSNKYGDLPWVVAHPIPSQSSRICYSVFMFSVKDITELVKASLTLSLLTWKIWRASSNPSNFNVYYSMTYVWQHWHKCI